MNAMQSTDVSERVDATRQKMAGMLPQKQKLEQYFSSAPLARLMASMMDYTQKEIKILDPGAGIGSLFSACVEEICKRRSLPDRIEVTAYEIDAGLHYNLNSSLGRVRKLCGSLGIGFFGKVAKDDFVGECAKLGAPGGFTHVIMNPPYKKIRTSSATYAALLDAGLRTTNMYAAFIATAQNLLDNGGQITFISPRSFCNGTYFEPFRKRLLSSMSLGRIHLFGSRSSSFREDGVLQENVIIHAEKGGTCRSVTVSTSRGPGDDMTKRHVKISDIILSGDRRQFIHVVPDKEAALVSRRMRRLECTLEDLGIGVSTGKVIDFRARDELRFRRIKGTIPLVRPSNISGGTVKFPVESSKHHNFIMNNKQSAKLLVDDGTYVLVKRFTAPEEKRRLVAAVWDGCGPGKVGFENKTNYFHRSGSGLERDIACGLWAFLNSAAADAYFRQFNGSTQVNAADLRYLRYPPADTIKALGKAVEQDFKALDQEKIDGMMERILFAEGRRAGS